MELRTEIETLIGKSGAEAVGVGYCDVLSGEQLFIRPDDAFHAASTMKVCVLMELFHQAESGELKLGDKVPIRNEFKSIVDGSSFGTHEEDDSEHTLYQKIGHEETLIRLARPMVTQSSNLATNLLVDRLGAKRIDQFMTDLGAPGISVLRGVEDGKAYKAGMNNTVTARGMTSLLTKLAKGEVVSPSASKHMVDMLACQTHRKGIPAGVPTHTRVACKPGWNAGICHDVAIVFPRKHPPYVLAVLTSGLSDPHAARELIASISTVVFKHRK